MNVGDLKYVLSIYPDDMQVILSSDGEGNSFSPAYVAEPACYEAETPYRGEVTEDDGVNALVIWPVA